MIRIPIITGPGSVFVLSLISLGISLTVGCENPHAKIDALEADYEHAQSAYQKSCRLGPTTPDCERLHAMATSKLEGLRRAQFEQH